MNFHQFNTPSHQRETSIGKIKLLLSCGQILSRAIYDSQPLFGIEGDELILIVVSSSTGDNTSHISFPLKEKTTRALLWLRPPLPTGALATCKPLIASSSSQNDTKVPLRSWFLKWDVCESNNLYMQ